MQITNVMQIYKYANTYSHIRQIGTTFALLASYNQITGLQPDKVKSYNKTLFWTFLLPGKSSISF